MLLIEEVESGSSGSCCVARFAHTVPLRGISLSVTLGPRIKGFGVKIMVYDGIRTFWELIITALQLGPGVSRLLP